MGPRFGRQKDGLSAPTSRLLNGRHAAFVWKIQSADRGIHFVVPIPDTET
jgi:hypothetical protein